MQVWPEFRNLHVSAPSTAASRSASSKTMNGALPPSSSETFFTLEAHCAISNFPTSVEPVKPSLRTIGADVSTRPISGASSALPVTIPSTPGGSPASSAEPGDSKRGQRCLLGRLQDHRAAGRQRGRSLSRHHRSREVPRRDPGGDADRLLRDDDPAIGHVGRDRVAVDALRLLAEPLQERRRILDLDPRLGDRLSLLGRQQAGERLGVLEHQIRPAAQDARPLLRQQATPRRQCRPRRPEARAPSRPRPSAGLRGSSPRSQGRRPGRSRRSRRGQLEQGQLGDGRHRQIIGSFSPA